MAADEEVEQTALEQLQPLRDLGEFAANGYEDPGDVQPLFEPWNPSANLRKDPVTGATSAIPLEERGPLFSDYKNYLRNVIGKPQGLPSPVQPAEIQQQTLNGLLDGTIALREYGQPLMLDGDPGSPFGEQFLTQTEWWSIHSGLTLEHIDMWEGQQAMWQDAQESIENFNNQLGISIARSRNNQVYMLFDKDFGNQLGQDWMDTIMFTLNRNIDEERFSVLWAEAAIGLQNRPDWLKNDEGKADFVMNLLTRNGQLSQEHMLETRQVEADPPPGFMDAMRGFGGAALGILDVLPEERLGFDVSGEISGGLSTALGAATGAPIINVGMQGLGAVLTPIDEYVVNPLRAEISENFAHGSFAGFSFGLDTANPYRVYLTPGQNLAISMGFDPGTDGFKNASGALDLVTYFAFDPLTYIAPMAKGHSLSKVKAASVAQVGTVGARLRTVGKALLPGKFVEGAGRNMALGWTGMKGPLTRAYYFATAKTAENLAKTADAQKFFARIHKSVESGRVGQLGADIPQLEGTKLLDQFEAAKSVDEVAQIWVDNVNGITAGKTSEGAVIGKFDRISNEIGADINRALEDGTIGALDVRGQRWGHSKYDGLVGLVDNGDGTFSKRDLTRSAHAGEEMFIWKDGAVKLANVNDLRNIARTNRGSARLPAGVRKILNNSGRTGEEMAGIWQSMNGNSKRRVFQWMEANGYHGMHFDNKVFLSEGGANSLIRAQDKATGSLGSIIGPRADEWKRADEILRELTIAPDTLDWIIDLPRPRSLGARTLDAIGNSTRLTTSRSQGAQRIRRMQARFTRAGKDFPTSIDVNNWQIGAKQLREIARRMGIQQDMVNDWVDLVRKTPRAKRFEEVAKIRAQMLDEVGNWRYKEGIAGGTIIDEGEVMYNSGPNGEMVARAKSRTRDMDVSVPYTPSLMSGAVPFWSETFYKEMTRLDFARSKRSLGLRNGFVGGSARERRAGLVDRYRRQLGADGLSDVISSFGEQDLYNMAFAHLTGDTNGLGRISQVSAKVVSAHKALHSQFSIMALALRPVGWLTKVVLLEEPIRAAMGGIPSLFTSPFRAVSEIYNGHLIRRAKKFVDELPQAFRATELQFDEILKGIHGSTDDIVEYTASLIDEFGEEVVRFLPDNAVDEIELQRRQAQALGEWNKTVDTDSEVMKLAAMDPDEFVQRYGNLGEGGVDYLPTHESGPIMGGLTDEAGVPFDDGTYGYMPVNDPRNTRINPEDPAFEATPMFGEHGSEIFIHEPTWYHVKDGRLVGKLVIEVTMDPISGEISKVNDFLIQVVDPSKTAMGRGAANSMLLNAIRDLGPAFKVDDMAELLLRGGGHGQGISLSADGARFVHKNLRRATPRPPRQEATTLSYAQAKFATDQLLNQYFDDLNLRMGGRVSFTKEVDKAVREVERATRRTAPKWVDPGHYGLEDIRNVGHDLAGEGVNIYSHTMFDEFRFRNDAGRRPTPLRQGDESTRLYSEGYTTNLVREANDSWQRYTVNRMLESRAGERLEDFIVRADWYQMKDNIKRIAAGEGAAVGLGDLELARWYFDTWAPKNVINNNLAEFWTAADGTVDAARRIEVLEGFLARDIPLPNGQTMSLTRQGVNAGKTAFKDYLDEGFANGERFTYLPANVIADQGAVYGLEGGLRLLQKPNEIMSRVIDKMGPKASEAVTREPGWRQVYGDYHKHYTALGWDANRADAAARIQATRTINDLMYNIDAMANWRVRFNGIVPFGAALVEVMEVWFKNLPRDNIGGGGVAGWLVGSAALTRRTQRLAQGLEAIGLLKRDENGELVLVADIDDETGTPLGNALSHGLANMFAAPVNFANMIANVVPLTADIDLPVPDRYSFQFGDPIRNPLDTDNGGPFAINRFSVGLAPHLAWGASEILEMSGIMGAKDKREYEGTTLQEILIDMDMDMGEFLSDPENRNTLRANGIDLDDVADDMDLFLLGVNPELTGDFYMPQSGFWQEVFGEYIFPYGAPQSPTEAIGDYVPGALQWLARSMENQFNPGVDLDGDEKRDLNTNTTPLTDWFFGPVAAYQSDAAMIKALMYDNARTGSLDTWMEIQKEITTLRLDMVQDGTAIMLDTDVDDKRNDRFRVNSQRDDAEDDPRWVEIEKLKQKMADQEEIITQRAVNTSSANMFVRSMTMFLAPTSPRLMAREEIEVGEFWQSVDFAEAIRRGEGQEAYTQWQQNVDPRNWNEMAGVVMSYLSQEDQFGFLDPSVSEVKREFLKNNQHLSLYLTPSKIYTERWRDTESIDAFFEGINDGSIKYADPEVFLMRSFKQQLSWQQGAERVLFFEGADSPEEAGVYALENWDQYQELNAKHKVERDFILFMDAEEFDGAYGKALAEERRIREEEGLAPVSLSAEVEQFRREQRLDDLKLLNQSLDTFLDELDSYDLDPADAKEIRSVLFGLKEIQDQLIETAGELNEYGAFSPEEAQISAYFDAVYSPFTSKLSVLYDQAFMATDKYDRSIAFDNIRAFSNRVWYSNPQVNGVTVPNPLKWQLEIKDPEELRLKAMRAIGKKVEWLHAADIEAIRRSSPTPGEVDKHLPQNLKEWTTYHIHNEFINQVEDQRLAGLITDTEASKVKKAAEERLEEVLVDQGLQLHVDFQRDTPAGQLRKLGLLDPVLYELADHAQLFTEQSDAMRQAGVTGIDNLWRQDYWPVMDYYLSNDPNLRKAFEETISIMYGETNWRNGARKLFLGKFGTE